MFDWLALASTGITFATLGPSIHGYISGFSLAKKVDLIGSKIEALDGEVHRVLGKIEKIGMHHYRSSNVGVLLPQQAIISPRSSNVFARPELGNVDYVNDYATEVPREFQQKFFADPKEFLFGVTKIGPSAPDLTFLKDPTLVPWHFRDGNVAKVGFVKRGYLDHLGIKYRRLFDDNSPNRERASSEAPIVTLREPSSENVSLGPSLKRGATSFARIKFFRGHPEFTGMHEYYVTCTLCRKKSDFPSDIYTSTYLQLRCPHCDTLFGVEFLRTNLSLRNYGW
jgi:hypothetical protein